MNRPPKWKRFWLCCRWGIRGCRIALLLVLLALISGFIWFNQIGMPDFAKTVLQDELKDRGLEIEFNRTYFKWFKGLVTEDLTVRPSEGRIGPSIAIKSADVDLDLNKLVRGELSVKSIELFQGIGTWEVNVTNETPHTLRIRNLNTEIRFLPDDQWQLTHFNANIQGIDTRVSGIITNASLARRQGAKKKKTQTPTESRKAVEDAEAQIHRVLTTFERFKFAVPPTITVELNADARDRGEVDAQISGTANLLNSPFGECRQFSINGQVTRAAETNAPIKASLSLGAGALKTEHLSSRQARAFVFFTLNRAGNWDVLWNTSFRDAASSQGEAKFVGIEGNASADALNTNEIRANITFSITSLKSPRLAAKNVRLSTSLAGNHRSLHIRRAEFKGRVSEFSQRGYRGDLATIEGNAATDKGSTNLFHSDLSLVIDRFSSPTANVRRLKLAGTLHGSQSERKMHRADLDVGIEEFKQGAFQADILNVTGQIETNASPASNLPTLQRLARWNADLKISGEHLSESRTRLESAVIDLTWRAPKLAVNSLRGRFPDGSFNIRAAADADTRRIEWQLNSDFSLTNIAHLLGPKTEKYLAQYNFREPPNIDLTGTLDLPAGNLKGISWKDDLEPTLTAAGYIAATAGDYRTLEFLNARTALSITNQTLILPDLFVDRPEGDAHLTYTNDLNTRDYAFGISSRINPHAVAPLLGEGERQGLDFLELRDSMPAVQGTLWGRWGDLKRTGVDINLRLTNIAVRAQQMDRLSAHLTFTNNSLVLNHPRVDRPEGSIYTDQIKIDTDIGRVYLTNVQSSIDFMVIPSIIGPKTAKAVSRYHFHKSPQIVVNGEISTHRDSEKDSDLHFDLVAPHFHWFKFNLTNATGRINWVTNQLYITNLKAGFYGGTLDGELWFDFDPPVGNDFTFDIGYTNAGLRPLIADLSNPTNRLEGHISGDIHVTSANTGYWDSWQGYGNLQLTNGLLWDIPVFGIISPIMNRILPGVKLGNSRAKEAIGTFVMTNSLIYTDDLIIHSPPARLYYDGTIDFDANINARVAARAFRDKFIVNKIFDAVTAPISTILQHRVYGTLANPKTEPVNALPKLLLSPLKPLQGIGKAIKGRPANGRTKKNGSP